MPLLPQRGSAPPSAKPGGDEAGGGTLRFILSLAILAWIVRSLIFAPFSIPSGSMLPTLYIGDYVIVAKWPYGYAKVSFPFGIPAFNGRIAGDLPDRGDVAVFRHPSGDIDLIKRVAGLPGDVVELRRGQLLVNGRATARRPIPPVGLRVSANSPCKTAFPAPPRVVQGPDGQACVYRAFRETLPGGATFTILDQVEGGPGDDFGPVAVPAGHVFMLGDNRDDSLDSRFSPAIGGVGMVPVDRLIGRAMFTFWSTDGTASYWKPWTWFTALRAGRLGNGYEDGE